MPLLLYNGGLLLLMVLFAPVWVPWVYFTVKRRHTFLQRFYMPSIPPPAKMTSKQGTIWIHALSVGEVLSAEPLVKQLARQKGAEHLVFTASTQTGFETAQRIIAPYVAALRYFPFDIGLSVIRALKVIHPAHVIIVETDIWPNFLFLLSRRGIPVDLVNARLSDRSLRGYQWIAFLMRPLLCKFRRICVQTGLDSARFRRLGVPGEKIATVGNMKFDQKPIVTSAEVRQALRARFDLPDPSLVWLAGSTHEGEEELLAQAYKKICAMGIGALCLIVAPRNPERAGAVANLFSTAGITAVCLEQVEQAQETPRAVVVVDRIGLLRDLYALADVAFVGGSLVAAGGHNPLEPASVAKPVLFGPHTEDFRWICQTLEAAGGAIRVATLDQLTDQLAALISDPSRRESIGRRAQRVFFQHRGAVAQTLAVIQSPAKGEDICGR